MKCALRAWEQLKRVFFLYPFSPRLLYNTIHHPAKLNDSCSSLYVQLIYAVLVCMLPARYPALSTIMCVSCTKAVALAPSMVCDSYSWSFLLIKFLPCTQG